MLGFARRIWHSPSATTWGSLAVRIGGVIVILPLVLVRFSPAEFAVWQLFASLFALMLVFDFGLSPTFSRLLAYGRGGVPISAMADMRRVSAGEHSVPSTAEGTPVGRIFATQRWIGVRLMLVLCAGLVTLGTASLVKPVAQVADPAATWAAWAVVVMCSGAGFLGNVYGSALQGMDRIAPMRRWETGFGLAQIGTCVAVLAAGGGLLALTIGHQAWVATSAVRNRLLLKALHPELFQQRSYRDREVVAAMWPATWRSGIGVLMSHGLVQSSGVIYGQLASAADVASYLLVLRLITAISLFSQAPFYSRLPEMATLHARGDGKTLVALATRSMRRAHWVFVAGCLVAGLCAPWLMHMANSKAAFPPLIVWVLMCFALFAERLGAMHLQLYSLTNHIVWHVANGTTGVLMIACAMILTPLAGAAAGFPASMLAAHALFYIPYSVAHSMKLIGSKAMSFEARCAVPPFLVLATGLLALAVR